jgi:hypothetical protein
MPNAAESHTSSGEEEPKKSTEPQSTYGTKEAEGKAQAAAAMINSFADVPDPDDDTASLSESFQKEDGSESPLRSGTPSNSSSATDSDEALLPVRARARVPTHLSAQKKLSSTQKKGTQKANALSSDTSKDPSTRCESLVLILPISN